MSQPPETAEYEPVSKHVSIVTIELPHPDISLIPVARTTTVLTLCKIVFPKGLVTADRNIARPGSGCLVYVPRGFNSLLRSQLSSVTVSRPMRPDSMQRMIERLTAEFCGKAAMKYMSMYVALSNDTPQFSDKRGPIPPEEQDTYGQRMLLLNRVAIKYPVNDVVNALLMHKV